MDLTYHVEWSGDILPDMPQPTGPWASIVRVSDGWAYTLTDEDVLWAAKMAAYEGDPAEVLWAMTQRFVHTRAQNWPSFTAFIREFSQPINEDWYEGGRYCPPGSTSARCTPELLAKREHIRRQTWDDVAAEKPSAVATTLQWAQGKLRNPVPGVVNFAAPSVVRRFLAQNPDSELRHRGDNWFIAEAKTKNWPSNYVVMIPSTGATALAEASAGRRFARNLLRPYPWGRSI
jgi:hypothetical protein